ncbi:MAG TPA: STAS domain-containing protein, partial [Polyangiaceae bacterium]
RLAGSVTFLRLPKLTAALASVPLDSELHVHLDDVTYMDHAAIVELGNWERQAERAGGKLVVEWETVTGLYAGTRIRQPSKPLSPAGDASIEPRPAA